MGNAGRVLMIPKGDYNPATTYEMLDCVYYNGRSYVCKQTSTGNAPTNTTYWQAMTPDSSAEIQALTNYTADTGVKNILNIYGEKSMSGNVNLTIENNGYSIAVSTSATWQSVRQWLRGLKKNTDYVLSFNFTMESGSPLTFIDNSDGTTVATLNPSTGLNVLNFNTGNYTDFQFYFYCMNGTAGTGSVHYANIMVCEKALYDSDPTYQPYAKTNVELTADVEQLNVTISDASSERDFFEKLITKLHNDITVTQKVYLGYALYLNNNSYSFEFIKLTDTLSRLEAYQSSRLIVAQNNNGTLLVKTVILTDMT